MPQKMSALIDGGDARGLTQASENEFGMNLVWKPHLRRTEAVPLIEM